MKLVGIVVGTLLVGTILVVWLLAHLASVLLPENDTPGEM